MTIFAMTIFATHAMAATALLVVGENLFWRSLGVFIFGHALYWSAFNPRLSNLRTKLHLPSMRAFRLCAILYVLAGLLIVALALSPSDASAQDNQDVTIDVRGPLVIGFFPPYSKAEESEDSVIEGLAHVRYALEDIAKCMNDKNATYRLEVTRSIVLREGRRLQRLNIAHDSENAVGIILAAPGRPQRTIVATVGPSTLMQLGPSAAAEYFGKPACRKY
jgi:hypothetical protein